VLAIALPVTLLFIISEIAKRTICAVVTYYGAFNETTLMICHDNPTSIMNQGLFHLDCESSLFILGKLPLLLILLHNVCFGFVLGGVPLSLTVCHEFVAL